MHEFIFIVLTNIGCRPDMFHNDVYWWQIYIGSSNDLVLEATTPQMFIMTAQNSAQMCQKVSFLTQST